MENENMKKPPCKINRKMKPPRKIRRKKPFSWLKKRSMPRPPSVTPAANLRRLIRQHIREEKERKKRK